jgi:hypothetical protein
VSGQRSWRSQRRKHFVGGAADKMFRLWLLTAAALCLLALSAAPALAAPEAPQTTGSKSVTATTAVLEGVLNPGATAKAGWYFAYSPEILCMAGGFTSSLENEALVQAEPVSSLVSELQPNKEYTFCLVARNEAGEEAPGNQLSFKTEPAPPKLEGEYTSAVSGTQAMLDARVNPNNENTTYFFEYATSEAAIGTSGATKVEGSPPAAELENFGDQTASVPTELLTPGTTYFYRVVAENAQSKIEGKPVEGKVEHFTAVPPATDVVSEVGTRTATFHGQVPLGSVATQYSFAYRLGGSCAGEGVTEKVELGTGSGSVAVSSAVSGLQSDRLYTVCLIASSAFGSQQAPPVTFRTLPDESVTEVTSTSAMLHATLDPEGAATTYHFEYLTEAGFQANGGSFTGPDKPVSAPEPEASAGAGAAQVSPSILIEGLAPGTVYRYRVIVHGGSGEAVSADHTFTTQPASTGAGLIDNRAWEMVSPSDKKGAALDSISLEGAVIQAAENGSGLAYTAKAPVTEPTGNRSIAEEQLLATRTSPGVWSTKDIETPHEGIAGLKLGEMSEYRQFTPDLSAGIVEPVGSTPLSPQASEHTPYRRDANGEYEPIVDPGDVPHGTKFGGNSPTENDGTGVEFVAATSDLNHAIVEAPQSLVQGFQAGTQQGELSLYEWDEGTLVPVSVLPNGASAITEVIPGTGARVGNEDSNMRNAISANGERVFFETRPEGGEQRLFMRNNALAPQSPLKSGKCSVVADACTIRLDESEEGVPPTVKSVAHFQYASPSGDRVFFTDEAQLTANAKSREGEPDLYVCEVTAVVPGEPDCRHHLEDVTGDINSGEAANVQGAVIGASEDASSVYFVANGVLSNGAVPVAGAIHGNCGPGSAGETPAAPSCNLYLWHNDAVRLVAVLSNRDFPDWEGNLTHLTARVSPDGRFLAFMSQRSLTGYDNLDVNSGVPDEEVFEYDARGERVVCVSCDPSGGRPAGARQPRKVEPPSLVDRALAWEEYWVAGLVPGWTSEHEGIALYQSRYLSNEGRLYFNSPVGLVPGDANGTQDVYEFEPEGVGSCRSSVSSADVVFVREVAGSTVDGCVGLISSGTSSEESAFLDASGMGPGGTEGEDVFFLTAAKLSPSDVDQSLDVYDAHVCSAVAPCPQQALAVPPACDTSDSCQAAPAPQPEVFGAPASATFSGPGNLTPSPAAPPAKPPTTAEVRAKHLKSALASCKKRYPHKKKKRQSCEKSARKAYGARAAKKSSGKAHR